MDKKGIVLNFDELHDEMIKLLQQSKLNVLGLHNWRSDGYFELKIDEMIQYMDSHEGQYLLEALKKHNIDLEYELHAMSWLLPRKLYNSRPHLFRMNDLGERTLDANCCVTNEEAIEIIQDNSVLLAKKLMPTSNRFFLWQDDNKPWCNCINCRDLSSSDQNLLLMNRILEAVKSVNREAELAFLAYMNTLDVVPSVIKPAKDIFLEITGPVIHKKEVKSLQAPHNNKHFQQLVNDQLEVFGAKGAHVLEYWLDVSLQSDWKRPAVKVNFDEEQAAKDIEYYVSAGFESITTFGVFMDKDYFDAHGTPPIIKYGELLDKA